ncbi:KinB-signaling pathway activation protein [Cohnella nanjingensis]|uniref:KinB-signaling pathway activation protein n=1 Tax=Cohnella nanjingensis TaxID=1387779 RepID=A0A7X0RWR3_9BACL|nr:KinB-signaling pathway activation protein [Cohnella nanjingensis]MBB6675093.1 KinB-signaling pathway activation protein [Cohnella nanjingensis]
MNLRKWMTLFGTTILIGAAASLVTGAIMQLCDPTFRDVDANGWLFNLFMMALAGLSFGAFAHMGFFAYLMLNYIARSIFKRPYLWVALQGFVAAFVLVEIAYWTYDSKFPAATFWLVPLLLLAASVGVAWLKVTETSAGAWIPTLFYMIAVTTVEAVPGFQSGGKWTALVFTIIPVFICNGYQIMRLHRILGPSRASGVTMGAN